MRSQIVGLSFLLLLLLPTGFAVADGLRVTTFSADITSPAGQPIGLGFIPVLQTTEHPLLARGILLQDSGVSCVICTLDWMEVHNESYDALRRVIGDAAGVPESHVALHCLHQHTAPAISMAAQRMELDALDPRRIATAEYLVDISHRIASAVQASRKHWRPISQIGTGRAKVDRVASNRRIVRADGSIEGRGSSTKSAPHLRDLEEGLIDPWVRTVSLENSEGAVAQLHYYASHPQSFYGDGRTSYDVPGIIRDQIERSSGVFQLYLTGCGGDIAFGKYNDGSLEAREQLTARLQAGIEQSISSLRKESVRPMKWSIEPVSFPLRMDDAFSEETNRAILQNPKSGEAERRKAAIAAAWIGRVQSGQPCEVSCLAIGSVRMLHLPGEPFVQYQLAAQQMQPDRFVCVAGYGDCGMGYIGGDRIYTDRGGYEQTYAFAGPCESLFLGVMKKLLRSSEPVSE